MNHQPKQLAEALNSTHHIVSECAKEFLTLTYNLAITKITLKIQATNPGNMIMCL